MEKFTKLTKIIKDEAGNESVVCAFFGTEKCRAIHNDGCTTCPMIAAMMNQLSLLEDYFIQQGESIDDENERR